MFDQLAGALGSLSLRREERRRREEKREEEKSRDGMVEMFRKSVEETGNTLQVKETQKTEDTSYVSQSNLQGMTRWGKVGNLDQGSGMPEGSARSRMFEEKKATTSRMPEDVARSGRVRKARGQSKGEVEVLRFLSLKLVGDQKCLQQYFHFTFYFTSLE